MATTQTVNSLVRTIRQRADQIGSSTFDDATELKPWVRASLAQLYAIMCGTHTEWYTVSAPVSLLAGVEAYQLPSDFRSLSALYMLYNGGTARQRLREFGIDDFGAFNSPAYYSVPLRYRLYRNLIYVQPVPMADAYNALELAYTPMHRAPLLDYTPCDEVMPEGFMEWVVLDVLQKMSVKTRLQNMDDILKSKAQVEARVTTTAASRTDNAPMMRDAMRPSYMPMQLGAPGGPLYWATA